MIKIKKNENLKDEIQMPLIRLFYSCQDALQLEDYELCGKIRDEMDRCKRLYKINKKALKRYWIVFGDFPLMTLV